MYKLLKKTNLTSLVLMIFTTSILLSSVIIVSADPDGIGKYLTINVQGEGYVTATKVNSGEVFLFNSTNNQNKVGAGTVLLEAFALEGWEFIEWKGDFLTNSENPVFFKTEKYATIDAVFKEKTYTITASSSSNGSIDPKGDVEVKNGADQTFDFNADDGYHVSSIIVDGSYLSGYSTSYTFYNVDANHTIFVSYSEDGTAVVPSGNNVSVFLGSGVGLTFFSTEGGVATGELEDFPENTSVVVWELNYTATFSGGAQVIIYYEQGDLTLEQEENLRLISGPSLEALYSDVNGDLYVDGTDVSIIANAVNTNQQPGWYDPELDINNDSLVDKEDIHVVNSYKGTVLEDITDYVDTDLNIIYGTTSHFSVFRCR